MDRLFIISPHASSGGLPAFVLKKIEVLINDFDIYFIEWENLSNDYVVQKNKIKHFIHKTH